MQHIKASHSIAIFTAILLLATAYVMINSMPINSSPVLTSSAFKDGGLIPEKYTCDGNYLNPSISVKGYVVDTPVFTLMQNLKPEENTKIGTEKRLNGHIIQKAELVGLYKRK